MVKVAVVCQVICDMWCHWLPAVGCWEDMNKNMLIDSLRVINLALLFLYEPKEGAFALHIKVWEGFASF